MTIFHQDRTLTHRCA